MPIITDMPSPRGTNHERLFILQGRKSTNPQAAYDSALPRLKTAADGERYARQLLARRGMACDLELPDAEDVRQNEIDEADAKIEESINGITEWCKGNLSHIDIRKLVSGLLDHVGAMDAQPRFSGMPVACTSESSSASAGTRRGMACEKFCSSRAFDGVGTALRW